MKRQFGVWFAARFYGQGMFSAQNILVALGQVDRAATLLAYASAPDWSGPAAEGAEEIRRQLVCQLVDLRRTIYQMHVVAQEAERSLVAMRVAAA